MNKKIAKVVQVILVEEYNDDMSVSQSWFTLDGYNIANFDQNTQATQDTTKATKVR